MDEALSCLGAVLDRHLAELAQKRQGPIPSIDEYREGLALLWDGLSGPQRAMLTSHAQADDALLSAGQLAKEAGYPNFESANLKYGEVGKLFADALSITLARRERDGSPVYTSALAAEGPPNELGHWRWRMHESLVAAMRALGLA